MNKKKADKLFSILVVLSPIIQLYYVPNTNVLLLDIFLFLLIINFIRTDKRIYIIKKSRSFMPLLMIMSIYLLYEFMSLDMNSFNRTIHNIYYIVILICFVPKHFDFKYALKIYKYVAIFSVIFIIAQTVLLHMFNYYLSGTIPLFETSIDVFNQTAASLTGLFTVRPRSIFSEPAGFCNFIILFLCIDLHYKKTFSRSLLIDVFLSLGILLSYSTTGYLLLSLIWMIWYWGYSNKTKNKVNSIIIFIIIFIILLMFFNSKYYIEFFNHTFGESSGLNGRVGDIINLLGEFKLTPTSVLFGHGMIDTINYYPGCVRIFIYFGISGVFAILLIFIIQIKNACELQKKIIYIVLLNSLFGDTIFGMNFIIFYPFFFIEIEKNERSE